MTRVYLVRHGTTEWNKEEIFRGRANCGLNETGMAEARALAEYFRGIPLDLVLSSPLSRATETVAAIAAAKNLPVIPAPAFIDIDFGEWQGVPLKEVKEKYADIYRLWLEHPEEVTFPKGENLGQVRERAWQGLMRVAQENPEKTVLIVTHRVITKILICAVLGLEDSHFWQIQQDTTAINCLEYIRGAFVAALINDTCHLKSIHPSSRKKDF